MIPEALFVAAALRVQPCGRLVKPRVGIGQVKMRVGIFRIQLQGGFEVRNRLVVLLSAVVQVAPESMAERILRRQGDVGIQLFQGLVVLVIGIDPGDRQVFLRPGVLG